jgi:tRNA threonylcarbamoyladenosine biosynthesis protein TsaE
MHKEICFLDTEQATQELAEKLANMAVYYLKQAQYKKNFIINLSGNLGTGKTTFTRYFVYKLAGNQKVKSPTYTLLEDYQFANCSIMSKIYHLDLYRLANPDEFSFLAVDELMNEPVGSIFLIEWPEKAEGLLPQPNLEINFKYLDQDKSVTGRSVELIYH